MANYGGGNRRKRKRRNPLIQIIGSIFFGTLIAVLTFFADLAHGISERLSFFGRRYLVWGVGLFALLIVVIVGVAAFRSSKRINAQKVYLDDLLLGTTSNVTITAEEIADLALLKLRADEGADIKVNEQVNVEPIHNKDKKNIDDLDYIVGKIYRGFTYTVLAAAISINGADVVTLKSAEEAADILNGIKAEYNDEGFNIVETTFVEQVEIFERYVDKSVIISKDKALFTLLSEKTENVAYKVQSGDSVWQISINTGLSAEEIYALNPDLGGDPTKLRVGQTISIARSVPLLSVRTRERVEYTEVVKMPRETRQNTEQPQAYSKIIQQGRDGQQRVVADIIRENRFETRREIVSATETVPPIAEITEVGTK